MSASPNKYRQRTESNESGEIHGPTKVLADHVVRDRYNVIELLRAELINAMSACGCTNLATITPDLLQLP